MFSNLFYANFSQWVGRWDLIQQSHQVSKKFYRYFRSAQTKIGVGMARKLLRGSASLWLHLLLYLLWFIVNNTFISRFLSLALCTHLGVIIDYHGGIELMRQKLADSQRIELRSFPVCCLCFCLPKLKISMLVLSWYNSQLINHPVDFLMSLNILSPKLISIL